MSQAPLTLLRFRMKTEQNVSVFALRSHCSAVKTKLFQKRYNEKAYENGAFWKRSAFSVNAKALHLKTLHIP